MATQAGGKLSDCKMITKCSAFSESVLAANGSGNSSVRNGLVYRFELPVATLSFDPAERPPYQQIGLIMLDLDTSKKVERISGALRMEGSLKDCDHNKSPTCLHWIPAR